jgi:hypothetical protein
VYVLRGGEDKLEGPLFNGRVSLRLLYDVEDGGVLGRVELEPRDLFGNQCSVQSSRVPYRERTDCRTLAYPRGNKRRPQLARDLVSIFEEKNHAAHLKFDSARKEMLI